MQENGDPMPDGVPLEVWRFFEEPLPDFADLGRIRRAQSFANQHLLPITTALFCASLPASYASGNGARLLAMTGRLRSDSDKRVNETAQFVLAVLRPGGLEAGGSGRVITTKVRLIHAAVRHSVRDRFAQPINQAELVGTLGLFSVLVLDSIERLGSPVAARDAEDFLHLWQVVGVMLGVERSLLAGSRAEASEIHRTVRHLLHELTDEGRALMAELLSGMERHMPAPAMRFFPHYLVRLLLGHDLASALGCPEVFHQQRALAKVVMRMSRAGSLAPLATPVVARALLEQMTRWKLGGEAARFPMPGALT